MDEVLWIDLLLFKDDIDAGVALRIHTAVIEAFAAFFGRGPGVSASSSGVLPHQDQSHKHDLVLAPFGSGVSV